MTNEYVALREEILLHFQIINKYKLVSIGASGTILGIAFSLSLECNPFLYLVPLIFLIPTLFNIAFRSEGILRISTYIQVFHHEKKQISGWETRLNKLIPNLPCLNNFTLFGRFFYNSTIFSLAIISIVLFSVNYGFVLFYTNILVMILSLLSLYGFFKILTVNKKRKKYLKMWRLILIDEN